MKSGCKIILGIGIFVFLMIFTGCAGNGQNVPANDGKLKIVASFYPMAEVARNIAGDKADVTTIIPAGVEPHEFEPTPNDLQKIYLADLIVLNGAGMENWFDKIDPGNDSKRAAVLRMSDHLKLLGSEAGTTRQYDPHLWLSLKNMVLIAGEMRSSLSKMDSANAAFYNNNYDQFDEKLKSLDLKFASCLSSCKRLDFVTSHAAFAYLARDYGLTQVAIAGVSPDQEPSLQKHSELTQYIKAHGVKYIFFESLISPKLAQTLAGETGAQTLVLNPLEGLSDAEIAQGKNYLSVMDENLKNLAVALECK